MTGAILIVSGRVPKTVRILIIAGIAVQFLPIRVEKILDCPADLRAGYVFRAFPIASGKATGLVLDAFQIGHRTVGTFRLAEPIPDEGVLRDAGGAHPLDIRVGGYGAVFALGLFNIG